MVEVLEVVVAPVAVVEVLEVALPGLLVVVVALCAEVVVLEVAPPRLATSECPAEEPVPGAVAACSQLASNAALRVAVASDAIA